MTNPFDLAYLTASAALGPFGWAFLALQVLGIAAGLYLMFVRRDSNALRGRLLYRLGFSLLVVGGVGVLLGALRLGDVPVFNQRYWFYLLLLVELALAGYALYYARNVYPAQLAHSSTSRGKAASARRPVARTLPSQPGQTRQNGTTDATPVQPVQPSSRRGARRDRKRRNR